LTRGFNDNDNFPRELNLAYIIAGIIGGVAAALTVVIMITARPQSTPADTWESIKHDTNPCTFRDFIRDHPNAHALRNLAEERERALGGCPTRQELQDRARAAEEALALAEQQRVAEEARQREAAAEKQIADAAAQTRREERARARRAAEQVQNRQDDAAYNVAQRSNTVNAYSRYLQSYPSGRHASAARRARTALQDDPAYQTAVRTNTTAAYNSYLISYPSGRNAAAARSALNRLRPAYDVAQLSQSVRRSAEAARAVVSRADGFANNARNARVEAEAAERRARRGSLGYEMVDEDDHDYYAGGSERELAHGHGVQRFRDGANEGDTYSGQFNDGQRHGVGVYTHATSYRNQWLRYEGQFWRNQRHGYGVYHRANGRYVGAMQDGYIHGAGVFYYSNGERYEGEWRQGMRHGYGVQWDAQGRALSTGVWSNDRLTNAN
jgi:hypothetical protein